MRGGAIIHFASSQFCCINWNKVSKVAYQRRFSIGQFPGIQCIPAMELNTCSPTCIQDVVWSRNGTLEDDDVRIYIWHSENL